MNGQDPRHQGEVHHQEGAIRRATWGIILLSLIGLCSRLGAQQRAADEAFGLFEDVVPLGPGRVWLVPAGGGATTLQPSIQAAVDAASSGDTVLLSDGLFVGPGNRDVLVSGKDLVIRSENGPARCVMDCQRRSRGFRFTGSGVTGATRLVGLTIRHGRSPPFSVGGAIEIRSPNTPVIESCVIYGCEANTVGGIFYQSLPGFPMGGVIRGCVVVGNRSTVGDGGGLWCSEGVTVEGCWIVGNEAGASGGGIHFANGVVRDCVIADNRSSSFGGGVFVLPSSRIEGCTIVGNQASRGGGLVIGSPAPMIRISNSILWGNASPLGDQVYHSAVFPSVASADFAYCLIEGGAADFYLEPTGAVLEQANPTTLAILDTDPLFADEASLDLRLTSLSPAVDAGDPAFVPLPHQADFQGEPRANGRRDMGADELYSGLALTYPMPGRAGEPNVVRARGASAGEHVFFFAGAGSGSTPFGFGACPSLSLDLASASYLGSRRADGLGSAAYGQHVPPAFSGLGVALQAVHFDLADPAAGCGTSNVISFVYP